MVAPRLTDAQLRELWHEDPLTFAQRLTIENLRNQHQTLSPLLLEQGRAVTALGKSRRIICIKPRQVGFTTVFTLFFFAKTFRAPNPRLVLQTTHDLPALERVRRMVDVAYENLPSQLKFGIKANNTRTEFKHNRATIRRMVAGVRSQGRSFTFTDYHATEMAFYPEGTSARRGSDTAADSDLLASVEAAMHDPMGHLVIESTGDGPRGAFYHLVMAAQRGIEGTEFVFVPWSMVSRYRWDDERDGPFPKNWERTPEEDALANLHGLDDRQLAWRRQKMAKSQLSTIRFKREYPLTYLDPFLLDEAAWFDQDALTLMSRLTSLHEGAVVDNELHVFLPYERGRRYFAGMDTAGGVGRDEAVVVILRDDLETAAVWASNRVAPDDQAGVLADIAKKYPGMLTLIEENKYGKLVIENAEMLGLDLWRGEENRYWYGTGQSGGDSKREMMTHARRVVVTGQARSVDPRTIIQLQTMVEDSRGRIAARGEGRDDRAIAWCLALWCAREYVGEAEAEDPSLVLARSQRAAVAEFERKWGGGR